MKILLMFVTVLTVITATAVLINPFRAPGNDKKTETVRIYSDDFGAAGLKLEEAGFVKSFLAFDVALKIKGIHGKVEPGGYYLSKSMNAWQIIDELNKGADLKEILIKEGLRKEQIGEVLQKTLGWSEEERIEWDGLHSHDDYFEGVYFPDTYLIPFEDGPNEVAQRMIANFNEKFAPYQEEFREKDIIWTSGLKLASIIQREAAGPSDMALISGILWNRLLKNQKLDIDATVQYAVGRPGNWWPRISGATIQNTDSLYNTYKRAGLPPTPISNPGVSAIEAALNPEKTDCIYYLHDRSRQIHCGVTYDEHKENIEKYLN